MCGRARCTLQREQMAQEAGVPAEEFVDADKYSPTENLGPGKYTPVVFQPKHERASSHEAQEEKPPHARLQAMKWGLVPSFTKPNTKPDHFMMFNARYYEWRQVDKREKQPYYFYREGAPLKFAGLYDKWTDADGLEMFSCTILTTDIAPELRWIHTRMPVMLSEEGVSRWLSDAKFEDVKDLLRSYSGSDFKWHPVDKRVGSMQYQSPDCAKKIDIKHAGDIKMFFGAKQPKKEPHAAAEPVGAAKVEPVAATTSLAVKESKVADKKDPAFPMGFVPASSLLSKRSSPGPDNRNNTFGSSFPSPKKVKSSPSKVGTKRIGEAKKGPLDRFFTRNSTG